ncbi:hypothetical protein WJX82_001984 [Trebouxia sp. C0006]
MSQSMTTVSELVDKGDIPEERKDNVKNILHDLGYAASRAVGKAFLKITEKHMTDAGMSIADANAILAEVELLQGPSEKMILTSNLPGLKLQPSTLSITCLLHPSAICHSADDMIKASHIYKRDWPAQTAAQLKLDVDTAANLFSAQKKIENAFDKSRPLLCPTICQTTYCIFWTLHWVLR